MDMTSVYAEITKTAPQEDGSLLVYGNATDSTLDMDQQICDPAWLKTAMPAWFRYGNIREQHDAKRAVGKATEYEATGDGKHMITAKIVDPVARAKVEAGVFTGFSIGIKNYRTAKSAEAKNGTLISGDIVEISLVDRPCNPNATLTVCKAAAAGWEGSPADLDEELGLVKCEELAFDVAEETVEKTTDVDHLEAPAPGQVCADCNEDGHLNCGPTDKAADTDELEVAPEAVKTAEEAQQVADELLELVKGAADEVTIVEFDREAAKALVEETLTKSAADGLGQDESGDISGADQAIALIAQLVISEAQDLAKMPSQGCDIHLLMSAVDALRCFSKREQIEQAGSDPDMALAADVGAEKAETVEKGEGVEPEAVEKAEGAKAHLDEGAPTMAELVKAAVDERMVAVEERIAEHEMQCPETVLKTLVGGDLTKDLLEKTATADSSEKDESPFHRLVKTIAVESNTELVEASAKSAAEVTSDLAARLEKVESMATPGGPALRRTEVERVNARKNDLVMEAARYKSMAGNSEDPDLRKGYAAKAAQLETEIRTLAV